MKRFFSLSALLLAITFLLFNSNSFTTAEIKNEAALSIVSEEEALIAINYEDGGKFTVTNNTEKAIEIESVQLTNSSFNDISNDEVSDITTIEPGESSEFTINGDPSDLIDPSIQLVARWDGGSAEIQSMIPEDYIAQWIQELEEVMELELVKVKVTPEICEEKVAFETDEEKATSEKDEEETTSKTDKEKSIPEMCKEKVAPEKDEEKAIPELDKEKTTPELNKEKTIPETIGEQLIPELIEIQPIPEINDEQ